ncbi:MAG: glutathione S-transferase family protein [Myxococcota bacterium]
MSSTLRLLYYPASQPSRSVQQLLMECSIPYEPQIVDVVAGENETPEFRAKYNPTGSIPILVDGDFCLFESAAIARYVAEKYDIPKHWFGETLPEKGRVEQYINWHWTYLRRGAGAFHYELIAPSIWGDHDYSREVRKGRVLLDESMQMIEGWLEKSPYLAGDKVSFADLLCYQEYVSNLGGEIITEADWQRLPKTAAWYAQMDARPHTEEINGTIREACKMLVSGGKLPFKRKTSMIKGTEVDGGYTREVNYTD